MKFPAVPWSPDQPALGSQFLTIAQNVIPGADHYRSFPSATAQGFDGMTGLAEGLTVGLRPTGEPVQFAASGGSIYRIPGRTVPVVDVSRDAEYGASYTILPNDRWRWAQYGSSQLAAQISEPLQYFDMSNISGNFRDVPNAPKAKFIARIRDFTVLGDIEEAPDGRIPYRLRWHGFNTATGLPDITQWTIGLDTRSDFQDVSDLGEMTGLTGGEFGVSLFRRGIARVDFGGQFLFEPRVVDNNIGCEVAGSVVQYGATTYFWSDEGVYRTSGGPAELVGTERVNRYLRGILDLGRTEDVWAHPDYGRGLIVWVVPITGASRLLVYRPALDRFSTLEVDLDSIGPTISFGLDLDDVTEFPDLDTDPRNLDDPALWTGGLLKLGGQVETGVGVDDYGYETETDLVAFDGTPLPGMLEWGEMEPGDGQRFLLTRAQIYHEGGTAQVVIGSREKLAGDGSNVVYSTPFNQQSDGFYRFRREGRYHRLRILLNDEWQTLRGADVRGAALGMR